MAITKLIKDFIFVILKISTLPIKKEFVPILMYHSIDESGSKISVSQQDFEKQMRYLYKHNYITISFQELLKWLNKKQEFFNKKPFIITFDDGYKNILNKALSILEKYKFRATLFIPVNFIGKNNSWCVNQKGIPKLEIMNQTDLKKLPEIFDIGSHSNSHRDLTKLPRKELAEEIHDSKTKLELISGSNITVFAYPDGWHSKSFFPLLKNEGYISAVSTKLGVVNRESNPYCLERININSGVDFFRFKTSLSLASNLFAKFSRFKKFIMKIKV